jgi:hypothetical protein
MPAKKTRPAGSASRPAEATHEPLYENTHQLGGINTGTLDGPAYQQGMGSPAQASRVALFNTGSGLRFTVALDRGSDIIEASFNQYNLAYLSPVGLRPPSPTAHATPAGWLDNFPGGLLATCGPQYIGGPRTEDDIAITLHGHHANTPSTIQSLTNPDPASGCHDMTLTTHTRDARFMGCVMDVQRTVRCTLGAAVIHLQDRVTNRSNQRRAHNWLYHVNLGYPLLAPGARFVYRGNTAYWQAPPPSGASSILVRQSARQLEAMKRVARPLEEHRGGGERGVIVELEPDDAGLAHVGLMNPKIKLGLELVFPVSQLPRVANWQHYGPGGSYVSGLEPFSGSLLGKAGDDYAQAAQYLEPGESRAYELTIRILHDARELAALGEHDGALTPR